MILRRSGMSRAVAAVVLALAILLAATPILTRTQHVSAAWAPAGALPGLGMGKVWSVAMDPADPAVVLAGTDAGVYRSADAGRTWVATSLTGHRVWTVGFDLRSPNPAFAGLDGQGLQRSDDAGSTWGDDSAGLPSTTVRSLAFGLSLVGVGTTNGVAVSAAGRGWQPVGLSGYDVTALAVSANLPMPTLVAGVDSGPAKSAGYLFRNVGPSTTWSPLDLGQNGVVVSAVAASPLPAAPGVRTLVVCTNVGVYRSNDGGTVWQKTFPAAADLTGATLTTVAFSPIDPALVFAGNDAGGSAGGLLLRSTDGGLTFFPSDTGLPGDREVESVAVAPATPPLVIAAVNPPGKAAVIYAQTDQTVPSPAATAPPEVAVALPSVIALPSAVATATPVVTAAPAADTGGGRLSRFVQWPLPLAVEILTALLALYVFVRWRKRRLNIEGPP